MSAAERHVERARAELALKLAEPRHRALRESYGLIVALEGAGFETAPVIERAAKKALREGGQYDIRTVLA